MAAVDQLLQVKVNWWYTHESLDCPTRRGLEGPKDPESSLSLHLSEMVQGALIVGLFKVPESCSVGRNWENARPVEESLMIRPQSSD